MQLTEQQHSTHRTTLLGSWVDPLCQASLARLTGAAAADSQQVLIAHHNLHSLYLILRDPKLAEVFNQADLIYADGMPVVWLARMKGANREQLQRFTFLDSLEGFLARLDKRVSRIYYVGSRPGVAEKAAVILMQKFSHLNIRTAHGYLAAEQQEQLIADINNFAPHVLMVGMGMPKQEHWVAMHRARLNANVIFTCGATADHTAGLTKVPPQWAGRVGLNWAFRLAGEPRRLGFRYLVEPWFVLWAFLRESLTGTPIVRRPADAGVAVPARAAAAGASSTEDV